MIAKIAGKVYEYDAVPALRRETAIIMPHAGSLKLTQLAIDAIAKLTPEPHSVWVSLDQRDAAPRDADGYVVCRTTIDKWWQPRRNVAGHAAAVAYTLAVEAMRAAPPEWVFFMHNDSLPLKSGWLSYLKDKAITHDGIAGVKLTEGTKAAHSSGVLMCWDIVKWLLDDGLLANMPAWDIVERPSQQRKTWTADSICNRYVTADWWGKFSCDVSFDDAGPFYVHFGGGTINRRRDVGAWVKAARRALNL